MTEKDREYQYLLLKMQAALAQIGPVELGNIWDCSAVEAGRRAKCERGVKLDEIARALAAAGVKLVATDDVIVGRRKYESLLDWAHDGMESERESMRSIPKRAGD